MLARVHKFIDIDAELAATLREGDLDSRPEIFEELEGHVFSNGIV
jgi:hypothetical protein